MPQLEALRPDHGSRVLAFELENRAYFAKSISDRGDSFFDDFDEQFEGLLAQMTSRNDAYYVYVADDGSVLGRFNLYGMNGGIAELGYRVAERVAGRGVATTGVRELSRIAGSAHGVHTLRAKTTHENVASQRVLLKSGFAVNGEADVAGRPGAWYEKILAAS